MRHLPLVVAVAALVACSPRVPSAQEVQARWGAYTLEAVDEWGRTLPTYDHRGRTYVLGTLGARYLLRFRNGSARRVEVVATVDGRDVVDGRPASLSRRGYVVEPWGEVTIDGFRVSQDAVAAFRFSTVPRSYAARKGDARDVGVVGVAVFPERRPRYVPPPRQLPYPSEGAGAGTRDEAERRAEAGPAPAAPRASGGAGGQAAGDVASGAPARKSAERPGLGTEFGEEHDSRVESTTFERASARPEAVLTLRYDDREGLLALGVDLDGRWSAREREAWRREQASPFRADGGYCEPPSGWRPGVR